MGQPQKEEVLLLKEQLQASLNREKLLERRLQEIEKEAKKQKSFVSFLEEENNRLSKLLEQKTVISQVKPIIF